MLPFFFFFLWFSFKRNFGWTWMMRILYIFSKISSMTVLAHCSLKWLKPFIDGLSIGADCKNFSKQPCTSNLTGMLILLFFFCDIKKYVYVFAYIWSSFSSMICFYKGEWYGHKLPTFVLHGGPCYIRGILLFSGTDDTCYDQWLTILSFHVYFFRTWLATV